MIAYLSKIIKFNKINVISIIRNDDSVSYCLLFVKKRNNKIDILGKRNFSSFEKLNEKLEKKNPVILLFDGKGILNKQIDHNNDIDLNWKKNIDYSSIHFTSYKTANSTFISFCRKSIIEETLTVFQKNSFQVLDFYIGSFLGSLLQGSIQQNTVISGDLELQFRDNELIGFTKNNEVPLKKYTIGNEIIQNRELPLYGAMLHFFVNHEAVEKTSDSNLNVEEIIYKKAFNFLGIAMLAGFLTTLLASYLLIQFYSAENAELNMKNIFSNQSGQKIITLENQKEEKLKIIRQLGTLSDKYLTFYAYELIKNTPSNIVMDELNVFPADKESKAGKKINFEAGTIKIKGATFHEKSIDDFMETLKKIEWIRTFEITSLKKDKNNKTVFEIKIKVNNV